jgi:hypothetical protein
MKTRYKNCPDCKDGICNRCKGTGKLKIINSRKKGNSFERNIAKLLSKWSNLNFKRTPLSGGWAKTGDITPISPIDMVSFPFNIEIKKYKHWDLNQILTTNFKCKIYKWWDQCINDAIKSNKTPLLIMGRDNDDTYCLCYNDTFNQFFCKNPPINLNFSYIANSTEKEVTIFLFNELLKIKYNYNK